MKYKNKKLCKFEYNCYKLLNLKFYQAPRLQLGAITARILQPALALYAQQCSMCIMLAFLLAGEREKESLTCVLCSIGTCRSRASAHNVCCSSSSISISTRGRRPLDAPAPALTRLRGDARGPDAPKFRSLSLLLIALCERDWHGPASRERERLSFSLSLSLSLSKAFQTNPWIMPKHAIIFFLSDAALTALRILLQRLYIILIYACELDEF